MPHGDGTGPRGFGPMTGRGFGFCRGRSHWGGRFIPFRYAQPSREDEIRVMWQEAAVLEEEKRALQQEIERLKKELQDRQ